MLSKQISTVALAVRPRIVLKYLGLLSLSLAAMTAVAALAAMALGEWDYAWRYALLTAVTVALGWPAGRLRVAPTLQANEALVVTALAFMLGALLLSWPLQVAGLSWLDAFFEAVSGITTTGLSTLPSVEAKSAMFHFSRAWAQWYGGLAITVLALLLVLQPGQAARRFLPGDEHGEDLLAGTRSRALRLAAIYAALTVLGFAVLLAAGIGPFDALLHVMAAVSTGGFSNHDASLAALGGWGAQAAVIAVCFAGALSFSLYHRLWRRDWRGVWTDPELRTLVLACAVVTLLAMGFLWRAGRLAPAEILRHAPILAISAQTTAGFASIDVGALDAGTKLVLTFAMFVGGDLGSTAGGIKITRLLMLAVLLRGIVVRSAVPRQAVISLRLRGRRLDEPFLLAVGATVAWFALITAGSWLAFLAWGYDPINALFEVTSAVGTVGLSTGLSAHLTDALPKLILCLDMLAGRLEVIALLVLIYPPTWLGRRAPSR